MSQHALDLIGHVLLGAMALISLAAFPIAMLTVFGRSKS